MKKESHKHADVTEKIIKSFYNVYNKMGYGFLEKVYENCMLVELSKLGLSCKKQYPIKVYYEDNEVGEYFADILVENKVIVELKASEKLKSENEAQLLNYLRATDVEVGILVNFGQIPEVRRKVFSKQYKNKSA